ncbi:hypothetical protein B2J93_7653 [Marssonina coronariae]|uniref:DUF1993 domain-containing protein n=1 Tax=Diplocarpon coronariae TaxID=2795749 RepID=A0A218ZCH4_9HELO|nr:hypothetical protein B2J93_7653 [Marssonina coronariae]
MPISLYELTIPVFLKNLRILSKLLDRGLEHVKDESNDLTEEILVSARLIANMEAFAYQVQSVSRTATSFLSNVGKLDIPAWEDSEKTVAELQARLQKTVALLETVRPEDVDAGEQRPAALQTKSGELKYETGISYALELALPNFFFHFVTAYGLLRKEGVEIGKAHYLGMK